MKWIKCQIETSTPSRKWMVVHWSMFYYQHSYRHTSNIGLYIKLTTWTTREKTATSIRLADWCICFTSVQILPFGFARQNRSHHMIQNPVFPPWLVHAKFNFGSLCCSWAYFLAPPCCKPLCHHFLPRWMINLHVDSKNTRQYDVYLFAISTVPLCSLESRRTLLLESRTALKWNC